jgi:hypothetical protein
LTRTNLIIDNVSMPLGTSEVQLPSLVDGCNVTVRSSVINSAAFLDVVDSFVSFADVRLPSTARCVYVPSTVSGSTFRFRRVQAAGGATEAVYFAGAASQSTFDVRDSVLGATQRAMRFGGALTDAAVTVDNVTVTSSGDHALSFDGTVANSTIAASNCVWAATTSGVQFHSAVSTGTAVNLQNIYVPGAPSLALMFDGPWSDSSITACDIRPKTFSIGPTSNTPVEFLNGTCVTPSRTLTVRASASASATPTVSASPALAISATATTTMTQSGHQTASQTQTLENAQTSSAPLTQSKSAPPTPSQSGSVTSLLPATSTAMPSTAVLPATTVAVAATGSVAASAAPVATLAAASRQLAADAAVAEGYAATVTVTVVNGTTASALTAVAYTDVAGSAVPYTTVSSDARCDNRTANHSVACSTAATPWTFSLRAAAPRYARRPVFVRVHVFASDAVACDIRVRLTATPTNGTVAGDATPADDVVSANTALRSVFSLSGGCSRVKTPVLLITCVIFLLAFAARVALALRPVSRDAALAEEAIRTEDTTPLASLPRQHLWVGAVAPCHRFCGPVHTALLFAHVLTMMAVVSSLLTAFHALAADAAVRMCFGLFAATVSTCVVAVLDVPFRWSAKVAATAPYFGASYRPQDLELFGVRRVAAVGVKPATMRNLPLVANEGSAAGAAKGVDPRMRYGATLSVTVVAGRRVGAGLASVVVVAAAVTTFVNAMPWCGARFETFEWTVFAALLLDVFVAQPAAVLGVWLWRWMISEVPHAVHSLHPFGGQTMPDPFDDADLDVDDATDDAAPAEELLMEDGHV